MKLPVMPPVDPMLAKVSSDIPPGLLYEPKWDVIELAVFGPAIESAVGGSLAPS